MTQRRDPNTPSGLSAAQVQSRIDAGQVNKSKRGGQKTVGQIVLSNIFTFFNLINLVLALLLVLVHSYENLLFVMVVVSNTVIGIVQELRAKRALDALAVLTQSQVLVLRDGKAYKLSVEALVMDDVFALAAGNQICADATVLDGEIEVDESLLSGEAEPLRKQAGDALYSGSFVVSGRAHAKVIHVGDANYAQQIAAEAKAHRLHPSELRNAINRILRIVSILIVPLGVGLFFRQYALDGDFSGAVVGAVAAVLGMIPEGLVLLTSIALAMGVVRLARRRTLVRELYCLETLARVDVLCLDKTGTLTEARMRVRALEPLIEGYDAERALGNLMRALPDENATAQALRARFAEREDWSSGRIVPFSSERKYSGAYFEGQGGYFVGAYEFLFPHGGHEDVRLRAEDGYEQGMRVLVLAHSDERGEDHALPDALRPIALVMLSDVIRADAKETLDYFAGQGVRLMVLSGDHPQTAARVAREAGLQDCTEAIDASTLTTPRLLEDALGRYRVFGRVTPQQKRLLVEALKQKGHTVAMVGDGVNDVPALKRADCSIAMAQGSDAAKGCANLVLLDSQFSALPSVLNEGRRVINNIQNAASLFLIKTFFSGMLTVLGLCFGFLYPFMPLHLTLVGSCCIGIPAFLLALEPNFQRIQPGFMRHVLYHALSGALVITANVLLITLLAPRLGGEAARDTLCVLSTGIVGLMMIARVYPLQTALRKLVFVAMALLFCALVTLGWDVLALTPLGAMPVLLLIALTLLSLPLIQLCYRMLHAYGTKRWG